MFIWSWARQSRKVAARKRREVADFYNGDPYRIAKNRERRARPAITPMSELKLRPPKNHDQAQSFRYDAKRMSLDVPPAAGT
jgi:hypothetical protein